MQGQCKPNAESSLYAEVQPVLAYRRQSYAIFPPVANFLAFISPTCSDNRPRRRQIKQTPSKLVLMGAMGAGAFAPLCHTADGWLWSLRFRYTWRCLKSVMMRKAWGNFVDPYYNTPRHKSQNDYTVGTNGDLTNLLVPTGKRHLGMGSKGEWIDAFRIFFVFSLPPPPKRWKH